MHCKSCDLELSDREATRKYIDIDEFLDLCHACTVKSGLLYRENQFIVDKPRDEEYIPTEKEIWGE